MLKIKSYIPELLFPVTLNEFSTSFSGPKVLANSMPKSGTHLLTRVLSLLPQLISRWAYHVDHNTWRVEQKIINIRRGQYLSAHLYWSQELTTICQDRDIRTLFIIRDLRDIAVSNAYYIFKNRRHRLSTYFRSLPSDSERLMASIVGVDGNLIADGIRSGSIAEHAIAFVPWLNDPNCLTIRFEDLIGTAGEGSEDQQIQAVSNIINHLGIDLPPSQVPEIAQKAFFTKARTFRKGKIGDWVNHFSEEHKQAFKETAGKVLIELGYATGYEW
ncbi:sulfotransferase domain-containing protein [Merismopedia glauca]|uniref:Sulfotransferase domain-containing protein n=1 Tax=Merismopedia glauca CCAP 1448/3 TaxID=1296344 RepID=A0A2T1C746_9CYAN|nr:sulfotransferase domain-containing protein [Merismopedia glauca]PSB04090.1 hypothetical protein C7B64_05500 [Merismopedia glauca CCAP 1448/3]